ncbi:RNA polymerase sigma factor [[Kitasatospora] papulosa]|uniref:RNA polymerase sigma factor n=1 Tax=[Kitasatospora] papulosa TaxID=1464011 RepID=UPI0036A2C9DE
MTKPSHEGSVPHQRRFPVLGRYSAEAELPAESRQQWCWVCDQEARLLRHTATLVGEDNEGEVFGHARESIFNQLKKGRVRSINAFARTVILNKARDHWRSTATRYKHEFSVGDTATLEAALPLDLGAGARNEEMKDYAAAMLSCLTSSELTAFVLMALDGVSAEEAARAINEMNGLNEKDVLEAHALAKAAKKRGERVTVLKDARGRRVMTDLNARQTVHRARTKLKERVERVPMGLPVAD